jgi:putative endonuclease
MSFLCWSSHHLSTSHVILSVACPAQSAGHAESKNPYPLMARYRKRRSYCVYIVGSLSGTLYIGVTSRLDQRILQHKQHTFAGFTSNYGADRLLYWESYDDVQRAIGREKQLKGWRREKKVALIELVNPHWVDLSKDSRPWTKSSPLSS